MQTASLHRIAKARISNIYDYARHNSTQQRTQDHALCPSPPRSVAEHQIIVISGMAQSRSDAHRRIRCIFKGATPCPKSNRPASCPNRNALSQRRHASPCLHPTRRRSRLLLVGVLGLEVTDTLTVKRNRFFALKHEILSKARSSEPAKIPFLVHF